MYVYNISYIEKGFVCGKQFSIFWHSFVCMCVCVYVDRDHITYTHICMKIHLIFIINKTSHPKALVLYVCVCTYVHTYVKNSKIIIIFILQKCISNTSIIVFFLLVVQKQRPLLYIQTHMYLCMYVDQKMFA